MITTTGQHDRIERMGCGSVYRILWIGDREYQAWSYDRRILVWSPFVWAKEPPRQLVAYCPAGADTGNSYRHEFSPPDLELTAHHSFVHGHMPAPVYADWLEENVSDVPAEALALLRGWLEETPS